MRHWADEREQKYQPLPRFPRVRRDVAFELRQDVPAGDVAAVIRESAGELLQSVDVFDVYQGANLAAGMKSLAFTLELLSRERTLTEAEIEAVMQRVIGRVQEVMRRHVAGCEGVTQNRQRQRHQRGQRTGLNSISSSPQMCGRWNTRSKALWERVRRAGDIIQQLREERRALLSQVEQLRGDVQHLQEELARKDQVAAEGPERAGRSVHCRRRRVPVQRGPGGDGAKGQGAAAKTRRISVMRWTVSTHDNG